MARITQRLSARSVAAAKPPGDKPVMLADGNGLYLHVSAAGAKSWVLRYRANGRRHDLGLGPYPLVGLADARERAVAQQRLQLDGVDPLAARRAARAFTRPAAATFRQCAERYIDAHAAGWRGSKSESQWRQSLNDHVFPSATTQAAATMVSEETAGTPLVSDAPAASVAADPPTQPIALSSKATPEAIEPPKTKADRVEGASELVSAEAMEHQAPHSADPPNPPPAALADLAPGSPLAATVAEVLISGRTPADALEGLQ